MKKCMLGYHFPLLQMSSLKQQFRSMEVGFYGKVNSILPVSDSASNHQFGGKRVYF